MELTLRAECWIKFCKFVVMLIKIYCSPRCYIHTVTGCTEVITNFVCDFSSRTYLRPLWHDPGISVPLSAVRDDLVSISEVNSSAGSLT